MPRARRIPDQPTADPAQIILDLQRELAQARAERDEALAQQTATAEVLLVINSSPGDLAPVFDAMLEKAMHLCEAAFGALMSYDGEQARAVSMRGFPPELAELYANPIVPRRDGDSPYARFLRGEPLLHIDDMAADEVRASLASRPRALVELGGARTGLELPLRKDGALLGSMWFFRQEVRPFTAKQIALLQNFAAQAVIAMENARLITETREALEQQTATAEVLGVINASPGDLAPVFDAILDKAMQLCGAAFGVMLVVEGERLDVVCAQSVPEAYAEFTRHNPIPPGAPGIAARIRSGEPFTQIIDLKDDDLYRSDSPHRRAMVDLGGARTSLIVTLRRDREVLGAINLYRQEVRPFSDKEIALLQNFAAQAVIAMENARLITETREALEQQTATAEVLQVINSSPGNLAPVFDAILEKAHTLCGVEYGALQLYDGEKFRAVAMRGLPVGFRELLARPYALEPDNPLRSLLDGGRLVHLHDVLAHHEEAPNPRSRMALDFGIRTMLFLPLRKDSRLMGLISAGRKEVRPFSDQEIALLENFAAQAVIAMENARLITETREALEHQTATAEVLQVINSSPGDLAPVFDVLLEKATQVCDAAFGIMNTYDGERFHTVAVHCLPPALAETYRHERPPPGPHSPLTLIAQGKDVVSIDDLTVGLGADLPRRRILIEQGGARSWVAVALRKDGLLLGTISAYRTEVRPFSDTQIALLQNFAAQAVIAMENARLITETREALEQQTATAEVLGVINSSPGDLAPVFDAMLEKAMRLCEASFGLMVTIDGAAVLTVAERDMPKAFSDFLVQHPPGVGPDTFFGRAVQRRSIVHTADMRSEEAYRGGQALAVAAVDHAGVRALLMAPLVKDDVVVGVFAIFRREARAFADKQIALLQNFAAQAVIAMENARLLTETRQALEQQTATVEVLGVINSSPGDLAPVFDAMLEKALRLCGAVYGSLLSFDGELFRNAAIVHADRQVGVGFLRRPPFPAPPGSVLDRIVRGADIVYTEDIPQDVDYRHEEPEFRELVAAGDYRSLLDVALRKDGALRGVIGIFRTEARPFTDKQIALLQNFAAQAVIAMENARLLGELRARTDEIAGWNTELEARVAAQLAEIERAGKLRRFLAPQLADLIVAQGDDKILESHRREIVVVFCDLRGFTGFAERAEPEEVMALLKDYHAAMGPIVVQHEGTIDHYGGDGIMVFFNDPLPTPDPARRAIDMAVAMRESAQPLLRSWRRHGHDLGFGVGIAQGYATLGQIGFAERMDYTAIGTVTNLAARLCAEAKNGQILLSARVAIAVEGSAVLEEIGDLALKGLSQAVAVYNVPQPAE